MKLAQRLRADKCTQPSNTRSCRSSESDIKKNVGRSVGLSVCPGIGPSLCPSIGWRAKGVSKIRSTVYTRMLQAVARGPPEGEQDPRKRVRQAHTVLNTLCENCNEAYVWAETRRVGDWLTAMQGNGLTAFLGWLVAWRCEDVDRSKRRCVFYFLSD